jgi:hypothetical protein
MDGVEEVIRIRIVKFDKLGRAHWAGMFDQPHTGAWAFPIPDLKVGDELVVALNWQLTAWVPNRIVDAGGRSIVPTTRSDPDEAMWVPGIESDDRPIAPGDLIIEDIVFTADDGSGHRSKRRPCVVVEISTNEVKFHPIHSTGGALHRSGRGIRLIDWQASGISRNSLVNRDLHQRVLDRPLKASRRIGRLSHRDFARIFGHKRP